MTDQDPGHANPSAQASAVAPAKERPEPAATVQESGTSSQAAKKEPRTSLMKDLGIPLLALAVTAITGYFGYQLNKRAQEAKRTESRSKIMEELNSDVPLQRELAAITLAEQGAEAFPTLHVILGTDNREFQVKACEVLRAISIMKPEDHATRRGIVTLIRNDIKGGDYVLFRGGALCASLKDFVTDEEGKDLVQAIEDRLGRGAEFCSPQKADQEGVKQAVLAESNFPMGGNAPAFLMGVIQNCPDASNAFLGAKETAIDNLCNVFKEVYPRNWSTELSNRVALLKPSKSIELENEKQRIGDPPCQE